MKKFRVVFLAALLLLGGITAYGAEEDNVWREEKGIITAWSGAESVAEIPDVVDGEPVTGIGAEVFAGMEQLTEVLIPAEVQSIGDRAFADSGISYLAFYGRELPQIAGNAFDGTELENVDISSQATKEQMLDAQAFFDGIGQHVRVWRMQNPEVDYTRDNLSTYEDGFMTGYTGEMTHIRPWNGVKTDPDSEAIPTTGIADRALKGNRVVTYFSVPYNEAFTYVGSEAFAGSVLETVDLFDSVTTIGDRAFADCAELADVRMSDSAEIIGEEAFAGCSSLTEITLPASLKELGDRAFADCTALTTVTVLCNPDILPEDTFAGCTAIAEIAVGEDAFEAENAHLAHRLGISIPISKAEWDVFGGTWYVNEVDDGSGGTKSAYELGWTTCFTLEEDGGVSYTEGRPETAGSAEESTPEEPEADFWWRPRGENVILTRNDREYILHLEEGRLTGQLEDGEILTFGREEAKPQEPAEDLEYEPAPVKPAKQISDFDGVWTAVAVEAGGNCLPVSKETKALENLLGVSRFELTIENGQVQWLGQLEAERFRFVDGRLQMLERGIRNVEPGTLDQIIELREDGLLSFTVLKITFYCEKTTEMTGKEK